MKHLFFLIALLLSLFAPAPVIAHDFSEGLKLLQAEKYEQALTVFTKAAEKGDLKAQTMLTHLYYPGDKNIPQNTEKATYWGKIAAEKGSPTAQITLGAIYSKRDENNKAVYWMKKAALQNEEMAYSFLCMSYISGKGVEQDYKKAIDWCEKAAAKGDSSGQFLLGLINEKGLSVPVDLVQAKNWYEKSAAQGYSMAKQKLAKQ